MPWKEELPSQGPAPSSSAQSRSGFSEVEDRLTRVLKEIEMGAGKINVTGSVDVSLAPISRFPWEVRVVGDVIRVYKGIAVNAQGVSDVRRSHIKVAGKSKNPIRITDSRAGSPGDFDWSPPPNQRDPYAVPPEGPGTQVAWPPFYVDGGYATAATNRRDPEPKDGGIPFSTYGAYIGKGGYDNSGADQNPWFEFPYAVGPIYVAGRTNAFGAQEVGVFQGEAGIDPTGWKVLIAYVSSPELVHQFFRSDLVMVGSSAGEPAEHPFKVKIVSYEEGSLEWTCNPGTVNNNTALTLVPEGMTYSGTLPAKVYLRIKYTGTPAAIDTSELYVAAYSDEMTCDDTYAYLKLAEVSSTAVSQYVLGSVWLDRLKVGTLDARYFFSRI